MLAKFPPPSTPILCWWSGLCLFSGEASRSLIRLPKVCSPSHGRRSRPGAESSAGLLSRPGRRLSGLFVSYCDRLKDLFMAVLVDMCAEGICRIESFQNPGRRLTLYSLLTQLTAFSITSAGCHFARITQWQREKFRCPRAVVLE